MDWENTQSKLRSAQYIRERLLQDAQIRQMVGDAIYPCSAPQTIGDYVVMTRSDYGVSSAKTGVYERRCNVIIEIFSDDYDRTLDIAEAIELFLSNEYELNMGCLLSQLQLVEATELFTDGKFVQVMEYSIS